MSGKYSIASRSGNLRAESDDGETLHLTVFDPKKPGAPYREWEGTVMLGDLRQIVAHFDDLNASSPAEALITELESDPKLAARLTHVVIKTLTRLSDA